MPVAWTCVVAVVVVVVQSDSSGYIFMDLLRLSLRCSRRAISSPCVHLGEKSKDKGYFFWVITPAIFPSVLVAVLFPLA